MTLLNRPGIVTVVNGPAPAGARRLDITEYDLDIAAYMDHIHLWAGAWQLASEGPRLTQRVWSGGAERIAQAVDPIVGKTAISGRTAWAFANDADSRLRIADATIPLSHTIYAAFRIDVDDTIGLIGNIGALSNRLFMRADAGGTGGLRYDHGTLASDVFIASGKWDLGAPAVVWAAYDETTKTVKIGGTSGGVVELDSTDTKVLVTDHQGGSGYDIGNALNFFGTFTMGDVIVASGDLTANAPDAHERIVTSLAAKYGLAAA